MPVGVTPPVDPIVDNVNVYPHGGTVCATAARTTAQDFGDLRPSGARALQVAINVTAFTAGSVTVTIQGVLPDGTTYTILASTALAATGVVRLIVSPDMLAVANKVANDIVPDTVRIHCAVADATPITYGIFACLTP